MGPAPLTLLAACLLFAAVVAKPKDYTGYHVVDVVPENQQQLETLLALLDNPQVDLWREPSEPGHKVTFSVGPEAYRHVRDALHQAGLHTHVTTDNLQGNIALERKLNDVQKEAEFNPLKYNRHPDINAYIESLGEKYDFCEVFSIGKSYEGRDMKMIKFGFPNATNSVVMAAGIHAREWISPATAIYSINKLVEEFSKGPSAMEIPNYLTWYVLPSMNPDGYEYSFDKERLWRKTRTPSTSGCYGADANRNFGFHWMEGGASSNPCAGTYAGPRPFSELEASNVRDFVLKTPDIDVYIAIHSYGQLWLIPWGYTTERPADYDDLEAKANIGAAAIRKTSGRTYTVGQTTRVLYVASGGDDDWAKGAAGIKYSYTLELRDTGKNGFILPPTEIQPTGEEYWAGITAMVNDIYKK